VVTAEESYRAGLRHGPTRLYDAAGRKVREVDYADGQPVGTARTFYPLSGRLQETTPHAGGKPEGWQVAYHPDGRTVQRRQHFKAGKPDGPPRLYDAKGRPLDPKRGKRGRTSFWRRLLGG
jgi:antitoxin component YwqK of YwqJK toxin-antitoxin module